MVKYQSIIINALSVFLYGFLVGTLWKKLLNFSNMPVYHEKQGIPQNLADNVS